MFVSGKPFQPGLMFLSKTGAYPSEAPLKCSTLALPASITPESPAKLIGPIRKLQRKQSVVNTAPGVKISQFLFSY